MIITKLSKFRSLITCHMPKPFDKDKKDSEGKKQLSSKTERKEEIRIALDPMIMDIHADETQTKKKLDSYLDALSRFEFGLIEMEIERSRIDDEYYQRHLQKIQIFKEQEIQVI